MEEYCSRHCWVAILILAVILQPKKTPLYYACKHGYTATAEMLIAKGAKVKANWV